MAMMTAHSERDKEIRQVLIDADFDPAEIEQKIGEGWTMLQIHEDAKRRGYFE